LKNLREKILKINELKLGMNEIKLTAKVVDVSEPREVRTKFGYRTRVATATIEDDTGKIPLTLWGKQIDEIGEGDTIEIKDGYINEFRGELQLNVPRKGELKKVD
jgi:replication factor A1